MKITMTTAAALLALGMLAACGERDEPIEENVEATGDEFGDAMDDAGDEIGEFGDDAMDAADDAGDDVEDTVDDLDGPGE